MRPVPHLRMTRRVSRDLERCLHSVELHPWGNSADREADINRSFQRILEAPELRRIEVQRRASGVELRRIGAAQFVIIYAYFRPSRRFQQGLVSIRAIRHRRERDVFAGVRQPDPPPYTAGAR